MKLFYSKYWKVDWHLQAGLPILPNKTLYIKSKIPLQGYDMAAISKKSTKYAMQTISKCRNLFSAFYLIQCDDMGKGPNQIFGLLLTNFSSTYQPDMKISNKNSFVIKCKTSKRCIEHVNYPLYPCKNPPTLVNLWNRWVVDRTSSVPSLSSVLIKIRLSI